MTVGPVCKYPGSKFRIAPWIIFHMPEHNHYVEPYFGSGGVFFSKAPAKLNTLNDINGHVVNLFRVMRESPEALAAAVEMTPWAREEYELSHDRDLDVLSPVEAARRFLVRTWQGHGSAADQHRNGWRVVLDEIAGPRRKPYRQWDSLPARILAAAAMLKDAQIECREATRVIEATAGQRTLLYVDPPYLLDLLGSRKGRKVYDDHMTDEEHEELLAVLVEYPGYVLLSGYDHPLYRLLDNEHDWARVETRALAEKGKIREEVLWLNPAAREAIGGRLF